MNPLLQKIVREGPRFVALVNGVRVGSSNRPEGARHVARSAIRAVLAYEREQALDRKIRRARQRCFDFDTDATMKHVDRFKLERERLRRSCLSWDAPTLTRKVRAAR